MGPLEGLSWQIHARWKGALSFLRGEWTIEDYPVRAKFFNVEAAREDLRRKPIPWSAMIINWPGMMGLGATREAALLDLREHLENYRKTRGKLPRPGVHVPIEFAASTRVDSHKELQHDFIKRVLDLPWAFISDESSLGDFHEEETDDTLVERIRSIYGVDVSDIKSGNLAEILEKITREKPEFATNDRLSAN